MTTVEAPTAILQIEMKNKEPEVIVVTCIDFRKLEQLLKLLESEDNLKSGQFRLLATAGAVMNSDIMSRANIEGKPVSLFIAASHFDCGYAINVKKDDSESAHKQSLATFGQSLQQINSDTTYKKHVLPFIEQVDNRHNCDAVAIILGEPRNLKLALDSIASQNFMGNCDIIARPYNLSADDQTIWGNLQENIEESLADLPISLRLHKPKKIFIFGGNQENDKMLIEKAKQIAPNLEFEAPLSSITIA